MSSRRRAHLDGSSLLVVDIIELSEYEEKPVVKSEVMWKSGIRPRPRWKATWRKWRRSSVLSLFFAVHTPWVRINQATDVWI